MDLTAENIAISATYNPLHVESSYAWSLANAFAQALSEIVVSQDKTVEEVDLSSEHTWDQLRLWTPVSPKASTTYIPDTISRHALHHPDATAVCSWDAELSYEALEKLSDRFAHYLQSLGVGPETPVLVCFDKSAWTVVTLLAILKSGGGFVPLDPSYPEARMIEIAEQTGAELVLASECYAQLQLLQIKTIAVDPLFLNSLPLQESSPRRLVGPHNLAYILFTSGSTGRPKGVVIEHEAFSMSMEAHGKALGLNAESRVLQFTSYSFDPSLTEIFATLVHGGCICVPEQNARITDLGRCIKNLKVNFKPRWNILRPH